MSLSGALCSRLFPGCFQDRLRYGTTGPTASQKEARAERLEVKSRKPDGTRSMCLHDCVGERKRSKLLERSARIRRTAGTCLAVGYAAFSRYLRVCTGKMPVLPEWVFILFSGSTGFQPVIKRLSCAKHVRGRIACVFPRFSANRAGKMPVLPLGQARCLRYVCRHDGCAAGTKPRGFQNSAFSIQPPPRSHSSSES